MIDTGIGITEDRQKMLFVPFLELKMKQKLEDVKDHNIGIGLACSYLITKVLGGEITLNESSKGFTRFSFTIPVNVIGSQDQIV